MTAPKTDNLALFPLAALVIGSMIGSGVFNLPQNMAESSGALAIIFAWIITFVGMLCLAKVFQQLALRRPDINTGPYGYAREGFGDYVGFNTAWGMWISAMAGNAGYMVMFFAGLGGFAAFDFFGDGTTPAAMIGALIGVWLVHALVLRGITLAAFVNTLVTMAKVIPVLFFIVVVLALFQGSIFSGGFWGPGGLADVAARAPDAFLGGVLSTPEGRTILVDQVKNSMLYTVWVFIGIESASIYAYRAKDMVTVGRATTIGFVVTILMYMAVSLLSLGIVSQEQLSQMDNPSTRGVIALALGPWAANIISAGIIISVGGAFLAWTMLAAEIIFNTSRGDHGTGPQWFRNVNSRGVPSTALWWSNVIVSLMLISAWVFGAGYNEIIMLATAMTLIPYTLSSLFAVHAAKKEDGHWDVRFLLIALVSSTYGVWLLYAAGLKYLLISMVLYAPAVLFFFYGRKQDKLPLLANKRELVCVIVVTCLGIFALIEMIAGNLTF